MRTGSEADSQLNELKVPIANYPRGRGYSQSPVVLSSRQVYTATPSSGTGKPRCSLQSGSQIFIEVGHFVSCSLFVFVSFGFAFPRLTE